MADDAKLELDSRRDIYQHVAANPGVHFRGLVSALDYAQGTIQYHLRWLESHDLVTASEDGSYTRYYATGEFDDDDRAILNALRREHARRIVAHLSADGALSTADLADRLDRSPSTVSWHLSKLAEEGLVTKERDGRRVEYELRDPERVRYLYTLYQKTFTDRVVDRIFDLWRSY